MRLDLILKHSGLVKRRTVAKYFCDHNLVTVNNKVCKPSYDVKDKDIIEVKMGDKLITFVVDIFQNGNKISLTYNLLNKNKENSDA